MQLMLMQQHFTQLLHQSEVNPKSQHCLLPLTSPEELI
jgi:hypothetical protein